jgi:3-hydroxybutyrate dehydrogenase
MSFSRFLVGKTAVVTGSLSGIGLGIAKQLSAAGANIVLNGFASKEEINKIQSQISSNNVKAKFIYADLTKPTDARNLIEQATKEFGAVDILVNNAGIQHISKVEEFPDEMWEKVIGLNLSSNFYTTKSVIPQMKQRGWGRIINIASVHGLVASVNKSAYVAAKHGLVGFTKAVGLETAGTGVTCNVICPGWVLTPLIEKQIDIIKQRDGLTTEQATHKLVSEKQPSGTFSYPEDIGGIATYLCTENAKQMTGASYTCDGGWTAQ